MSDDEIYKMFEQAGIYVCEQEPGGGWGYQITTQRLSVDWRGYYRERTQALQAALTWVMSTMIEGIILQGREHTHLFTGSRELNDEELQTLERYLEA